jgi:hypothetical protein
MELIGVDFEWGSRVGGFSDLQPDELLGNLLRSVGVAGWIVALVMFGFLVLAWVESGKLAFRGGRWSARALRRVHARLRGRSPYRWGVAGVLGVVPVVFHVALIFVSAVFMAYLFSEYGSDRSEAAYQAAIREGPGAGSVGALLEDPFTRNHTVVLGLCLLLAYGLAPADPARVNLIGFAYGATGVLLLPWVPIILLLCLAAVLFAILVVFMAVKAAFDAGEPGDWEFLGAWPLGVLGLVIALYGLALMCAFALPSMCLSLGKAVFDRPAGGGPPGPGPVATWWSAFNSRV